MKSRFLRSDVTERVLTKEDLYQAGVVSRPTETYLETLEAFEAL